MKTVFVAPFDPVTTKEIEYAHSLLKKKDITTVYLIPWGKGVLSMTERIRLLKTAIMPYGHLETNTAINRDDEIYCMDDAEVEEQRVRDGDFFLVPKSVRRILLEEGFYFEEVARAHCKPKRFAHSVSVAKTAVMLAHVHHLDEKKAWKAGILHDVTKSMSDEEAEKIIKRDKPEWLSISPKVWHSYTACVWIKNHLGPLDDDILKAIEHHTLGDGKTDLDRILYIADKIEPTRDYDVSSETELAMRDLKKAAELVLEESKAYILETEGKHV